MKLESAVTKQRVALTSGSYVINRLATFNQPKNSGFTMDFRVLNSGVPEGATRNPRLLDCLLWRIFDGSGTLAKARVLATGFP